MTDETGAPARLKEIITTARADFAELHAATAGTPAHAIGLRLHAQATQLAKLADEVLPGHGFENEAGHDKPDEPEEPGEGGGEGGGG